MTMITDPLPAGGRPPHKTPAMTTTPEQTPPAADAALSPLRQRLRRIAGQVLAIERMLGENRSCADVLIQLAAVSAGRLPSVAAAEEAAPRSGALPAEFRPTAG